ncbi:hypothetical protein HZS_5315 [Henneguya salminicola]|uniref:Iroquois-class homeodomain protein irx-1-A (Trinotate prediction) n=1 Tax=Henneguya salminicola TaxID=69463 RepID=A0A6G3MHC3_HENSL|nr:hypothetical protein HZS_5315 [Henneguya salminicola]
MERSENKIPMEYQNLVNYNQATWAQNPYANSLYLNGFDPTIPAPTNHLCQVICTQAQSTVSNYDYYRYGLIANSQLQPTNTNFLIEASKTSFNPSRYSLDENYSNLQNTMHLQQRSGPMRTWLNGHLEDPYPSSQEKQKLADECNKSYIQVCTWFANARRSLRRQGAIGPRIRRNKSSSNFDLSETNSTNSAHNVNLHSNGPYCDMNDRVPSMNSSLRVPTSNTTANINQPNN